MDTQYTQGFKAGMVWREIEIIKLLKQVNEENTRPNLKPDSDLPTFNTRQLIALIKGEK